MPQQQVDSPASGTIIGTIVQGIRATHDDLEYQHGLSPCEEALHLESLYRPLEERVDEPGPWNTLPGRVAKIIVQCGAPMAEDALLKEVEKVYDKLRKSDNTRYRGACALALRGALCSTNLFHRTEEGTWCLKEDTIRILIARVKPKQDRKRSRGSSTANTQTGDGAAAKAVAVQGDPRVLDGPKAGGSVPFVQARVPEDEPPALKRVCVNEEHLRQYTQVCELLTNLSVSLADDPECALCFANPFLGVDLTSETDLWNKLGHEKCIALLQFFTFMSPMLLASKEVVRVPCDAEAHRRNWAAMDLLNEDGSALGRTPRATHHSAAHTRAVGSASDAMCCGALPLGASPHLRHAIPQPYAAPSDPAMGEYYAALGMAREDSAAMAQCAHSSAMAEHLSRMHAHRIREGNPFALPASQRNVSLDSHVHSSQDMGDYLLHHYPYRAAGLDAASAHNAAPNCVAAEHMMHTTDHNQRILQSLHSRGLLRETDCWP